jgi:hypothetical protein
MRSRWEEPGADDLDAPATITERQLRSLRRRAGAGVFAMLLSLVSIGAVAWSMLAGPDVRAEIQSLTARILPEREAAAETEETPGQAVPVGPQSPGADSTSTPAPAPAPATGPSPP